MQQGIESSQSKTEPTLNIVMVYEDLQSGRVAMKACDCLSRTLGKDYHVLNNMWKFDLIAVPKMKELALGDVMTADIVIFSAHDEHELPDAVRAWIERWLKERDDRPTALVALVDTIDQTLDGNYHLSTYLKKVAQRGHMDFYSHTIASGDEDLDFTGDFKNLALVPGHPFSRN